MALLINNECINCDVCEEVCPNNAIYEGDIIYEINPEKCTECIMDFKEPQCQTVCPVDCIEKDKNFLETIDMLKKKHNKLKINRKKR